MRPDFEQAEPSPLLPKILLAVALLAVAGLAYFLWRSTQSDNDTHKVVVAPPPTAVVAEPEPEPQQPVVEEAVPEPIVEQQPPPEPLPALDKSDEFVTEAVSKLALGDALAKLIIPDNFLLKAVRAVMALDEGNVVHDYRPLQAPAPAFKVEKINEPLDIDVGQRYVLSAENYARYQPWVEALSRVDKQAVASLYKRLSPLLEEAYLQYGVDRGNFHNVMLSVIDKVLAVPVLDREIVLVQPKVFFQYEDPALEKAPQINRLLWRMGPENTKAIQASLTELKKTLVALNLPRKSN